MGSFKDYDRMPFPQSTGILSAFFILGLGVVLLTMFSSSVDAGSVPHAPISITGDSEFTSSNGVVSGSGKPSDPYFIQNWRIDASSDIGIQIYSTDRYYIIRNITLSGESSTPGYTIYTEYSNNGTFEDIYDDRNLSRLWIKDAKNLVMHNYTQSRPDDPLERGPFALLGCRSARVSNLSLSGRLYFTVMDDAVLTRSTARDYYLRSTKRLTVLDCTNRGDDEHDGIFLFYMEDSLIKNCTINNTRSADIRIEKSSNITVSKCTMDSWGLVVSLDGYHHLDDSNKVNGSLVHSFINRSDFTHQSSSSQMFFFGCSDFTVANVTIWDTASPIHLYECRNVLIDNVTISGRFSYMYMARCDDVTLSNITTHSYRGSGRSPVLYIYDSPNVLVRDSLLSYCQLRFYIDRLKDVPSGALTVLNTTFAHSSSGGIRFATLCGIAR